jgi:hypothetical protein
VSSPFRTARAVVFATVCVALATAGHVMASGESVPPVAALAGLAGLSVVGYALAGTERSLATILGGLLGGQFMLHALFAAAQHGQHLAHGHAMAPSSGGVSMTLAHVLAAVVSAWWLRRGERAVWDLARKIAAAVVRPAVTLLTAPAPPSPVARAAAAAEPATPGRILLRHVLVRRGPPSPSTALA